MAADSTHINRRWLRAVAVDSALSFLAVLIFSAVFVACGAVILGPQQKIPGGSNLLAETAVRELRAWRGQVAIELRMPVSRKEAARLNRVPRFSARVVQGSIRDKSLRRVHAESVRAVPRTPLPVKERPCPDATLRGRSGADEVLVAPSGVDSCLLDWLARRRA